MIYVLGGRLAFQNDSRRDNAVTQITAYAQQFTADLFHPAQVAPYDGTYKNWPHAVNFELWFQTQTNRDNLWAQADARLGTGVNGPVAGAMLWRTDTNFDDPTGPPGTLSEQRTY